MLSRVQLFVTLQATLSMGFLRHEYWSEEPFPTPGEIFTQGSNPCLLCLLPYRQILYPPSHQGSSFCFVLATKFRQKLKFSKYTCHQSCKMLPTRQTEEKPQRINSRAGKIPWRRERLLNPVFLPGEFHGQRSLVHYCPWGLKRVGHDLATK